jgi:hypothetical protein
MLDREAWRSRISIIVKENTLLDREAWRSRISMIVKENSRKLERETRSDIVV